MGIFKYRAGNIPGENFLGRNFPGVIQHGCWIIGNCPGCSFPNTTQKTKNSLMQDKPKLFFIFYNVIWPQIQDRTNNFYMEHTLKIIVQNEAQN